MWELRCWSSTVEWFTRVARNSPPSTRRGGIDCLISETNAGDGSMRLVAFHRKTSSHPSACGASGLKKRLPSKCFGNCGSLLAARTTHPPETPPVYLLAKPALRCTRHATVFLFRGGGQQNPQSINAENRAERHVYHVQARHDDGQGASPRFAFKQAPTGNQS